MEIKNSAKRLCSTIGNTPLIQLNKFAPNANLFAKLENFNPLGSVKDRTAWSMIREAEKANKIKKGDQIVEPSSGNTGIALAWISNARSYKLTLVMPGSVSLERRKIASFLGAKVVLTAKELGMKGARDKAERIAMEEGAFMPDQFSNPANPKIHLESTGPEIWDQMAGKIGMAIFGVGTGGTLSGVAQFLKKQDKSIKIIAVEPEESAVLSGNNPGAHKIEGIGAGFIPEILKKDLIDQVETASSKEAMESSREIAKKEGIFVGISSGAVAFVARNIANKNPNKNIVTLFPDTASRYFSTDLFKP